MIIGASYFGGDDDDYDVLKHSSRTVVNGDAVAFQQAGRSGLAEDEMRSLLNVTDLAIYWLANVFVGNTDWDQHNWYTCRARDGSRGGFRWLYVSLSLSLSLFSPSLSLTSSSLYTHLHCTLSWISFSFFGYSTKRPYRTTIMNSNTPTMIASRFQSRLGVSPIGGIAPVLRRVKT